HDMLPPKSHALPHGTKLHFQLARVILGRCSDLETKLGRSVADTILNVVRAEDQIAGFCPGCGDLFRLSEVELFYIPDRKDDFLGELRRKEAELAERVEDERADDIKRTRASLMGTLLER